MRRLKYYIFTTIQAAKAEKPQKHRVRRSGREEPGPLIPNQQGYTPNSRDQIPNKEAFGLSTQDMIARELAEMRGREQ
jgi:hypothetical protein